MRQLPRAAPALVVALLACGRSGEPAERAGGDDPGPERAADARAAADITTAADAAPAADPAAPACTRLPFAADLPVPEASGADWFEGADGPTILVVSDSGNRGAWVEIDAGSGKVTPQGNLKLDKGASDDLEGLAIVGDTAYAITSSGYVREWTRGKGGKPARTAYPIGPAGDTPEALACADPRAVNCGRNYEGLCVADPPPATGCAGYAVSKRDGLLICVTVAADGHLIGDPARTLAVGKPEHLTGCEISPEGDRMWVGANLFGRNAVWVVSEWSDPARARVVHVGDFGPGFGEAIAVAPGAIVYRFSDTGGSPSLVEKWGCRR